jgi:protein pelota
LGQISWTPQNTWHHYPRTRHNPYWRSSHYQRLIKPLLIIAIDDEGYAIAETKQYGVEIRVEERVKLPGKYEAEKRQGATNEYYKRALNSLAQLWQQNHNAVVIVGVGYVKNDFANYLRDSNSEIGKSIMDIKSVNNGGVAGIYESLRSGVLLRTAHQMRIIEETEVMEEVMKRLGKEEAKVAYGLQNVENAANMGAIEKLIIADTQIRESEDEQRLNIEKIMREVEHRQGAVIVVSTEHEAGSKLLALGGVAALLRFPLYRET